MDKSLGSMYVGLIDDYGDAVIKCTDGAIRVISHIVQERSKVLKTKSVHDFISGQSMDIT